MKAKTKKKKSKKAPRLSKKKLRTRALLLTVLTLAVLGALGLYIRHALITQGFVHIQVTLMPFLAILLGITGYQIALWWRS